MFRQHSSNQGLTYSSRRKAWLMVHQPTLLPVVMNIHMKYFKGMVPLKSTTQLKYIIDIAIYWPCQEDMEILLNYMNSVRPWIHFKMNQETKNQLAFPDGLISNTENEFNKSVSHKSTFTKQYINFNFHHPSSVKKGIVQNM